VPTAERGGGGKGAWHYWVGAGPGKRAWTRWWRKGCCWSRVDKGLECDPVERWEEMEARGRQRYTVDHNIEYTGGLKVNTGLGHQSIVTKPI